jgi:5-deoxy-glucuronate isomerase
MKYHFKLHEWTGQRLEPHRIGLEYISAHRFELNGSMEVLTGEEEVCLVCLSGGVEFAVGGALRRANVKDMLYIPRRVAVGLSAHAGAVVVRFGAPADADTEFAHFTFASIDADPSRHKVYGTRATSCRRDVWEFLGDAFPARRLMVGLCRGDVGGWTGWPPHEHACKREEVYVYFDMAQAFGMQCVYEELDDAASVALVTDGDLVSVPRGYHPSVACPGGCMSFVYCMAAKQPGDRRFLDLNIQAIYGDKFE